MNSRGPGLAALFEGLVDDAAVFPPGNAALDVAVRRHRAHRRSRYAAAVGPLLVPATAAAEVSAAARAHRAGSTLAPLEVSLVVRPGGDLAAVARAMRDVDGARSAAPGDAAPVRVVGAELGWQPRWRQALPTGSVVPVALELPRGPGQPEALADIADGTTAGERVVAKFRTGATQTWSWPDEDELAQVIVAVVGLGVPLKLTGGLHHAVRGRYGADAPEENHGILNVLLAVAEALSSEHARTGGAGSPDDAAAAEAGVRGVLAERDAERLVWLAQALRPRQVAAVRDVFVSYGCCEVTDPLGELADLGLLDVVVEPPD